MSVTVSEQERPTDAPGEPVADSATCEEHRENLLDDALDDSFPASDPPSLTQPAGPEGKCR